MDKGEVTALTLLDLSVAFETQVPGCLGMSGGISPGQEGKRSR